MNLQRQPATAPADGFTKLRQLRQDEHGLQQNRPRCKICSKTFLSADAMAVHMTTHPDLQPFKCSECDKSFSYVCSLRRHMIAHSDDRPLTCSTCDAAFKEVTTLRRHERKLHGGDTGARPMCVVCLETFHSEKFLLRHQSRRHRVNVSSWFGCELCPSRFLNKHYLKKHKLRHKSVQSLYDCPFCERSYYSADTVEVHRKAQVGGQSCDKFPGECLLSDDSQDAVTDDGNFEKDAGKNAPGSTSGNGDVITVFGSAVGQSELGICYKTLPASAATESALSSAPGSQEGSGRLGCNICGLTFDKSELNKFRVHRNSHPGHGPRRRRKTGGVALLPSWPNERLVRRKPSGEREETATKPSSPVNAWSSDKMTRGGVQANAVATAPAASSVTTAAAANEVGGNRKRFGCNVCGLTFDGSEAADFKKHRASHDPPKRRLCDPLKPKMTNKRLVGLGPPRLQPLNFSVDTKPRSYFELDDGDFRTSLTALCSTVFESEM